MIRLMPGIILRLLMPETFSSKNYFSFPMRPYFSARWPESAFLTFEPVYWVALG